MRIHQLINSYSLKAGGAERLVRRMHRSMVERGQACHLVGLLGVEGRESIESRGAIPERTAPKGIIKDRRPVSPSDGEPFEKAQDRSVSRLDGDLQNAICFGLETPYSITAFRKVFQYIRYEVAEGEIVHAHLSPTLFYCTIAKRILRKRFYLIATEHNSHNNRRGTMHGRLLDNFLYRSLDHIACISEGAKEALNQWMPCTANKSSVIYNGIPLTFDGIPERSESGTIKIVSVGRLHKQKNFENALRAVALVMANELRVKGQGLNDSAEDSPLTTHHSSLQIEYLVAGSGEMETELKALAEALGIAEHVRFLGHVSDIPSLLKEADIFLIPSLWEGFGLAAVEAMNAGLPVIASDVDGIKELIEGEKPTGILVDPLSPKSIADAIQQLCTSPAQRDELGKNGFERAKDFSEAQMIEGYVRLYESVGR